MRTETVTYKDVQSVCDRIECTGRLITTRQIRHELKRGSLSTISKHLKTWYNARSNVHPIRQDVVNVQDSRDCTPLLEAEIQSLQSSISTILATLQQIESRTEVPRTEPDSIQDLQASLSSVQTDLRQSVQEILEVSRSVQIATKIDGKPCGAFGWQDFAILAADPMAFFLTLAVVTITSLLISFQMEAYISAGLESMALPIAVVCEVGMVIIAALFSAGIYRKMSAVLFIAVFSYVIATMSYDIKSTAHQEINKTVSDNDQIAAIKKELDKYTDALDVATKKQENGNMSKWSNKIDATKLELAALQVSASESSGVMLIEAKYSGLTALRALLMLINAFFVHALIGAFRNEKK